MTFKRLAPNMTGIAKKNENSLATVLEQPQYKPPKIVAPLLEVPGIKLDIESSQSLKPKDNQLVQSFPSFLV